ncbi:glycosyltransferase family 2 protein [Alteromonas macleodii]|uniref:glycosyltransferase family 2 protein n=1 Tax=Alteromonas macleodii TaxID=28108 RepID=UPI003BF8BB4A
MKPKITALMTTYNAEAWVDETIDSVLNQTYSTFEFLIIDDGSSDGTVERIKRYSDKRIKLIENHKNMGVGACLDAALDIIDTQYIVKVDADDISESTRFEKQLSFLESNELDIVKSFITYFPDNEKVRDSERFKQFVSEKQVLLNQVNTPDDISATLSRWLCFLHTSYFARTGAIKNVRYPHTRLYEDYILFLRLKNAGYKFGCVNEPLVHIRLSDSSATTSLGIAELENGLKGIIEEKWPNFASLVGEKDIYIYGTGNMAKACAQCLSSFNVKTRGFVEKLGSEDTISVADYVVGVCGLDEYLSLNTKRIIIVAAQPVRSEVIHQLEFYGKTEFEDFLILA